MEEIWKTIDGYPNYMVSSKGRVKSLERVIMKSNGKRQTIKETIRKGVKDKDGYLIVTLYDEYHNMKNVKKHRLVAIAFVQIPEHLKEIPIDMLDVHHLNGDKNDNRLENLIWIKKKEHNKEHETTRLANVIKNLSKKCYQYDLNKKLINIFPSTQEASKLTGICQSNISACCRGEYKTTHDYIFSYQSL